MYKKLGAAIAAAMIVAGAAGAAHAEDDTAFIIGGIDGAGKNLYGYIGAGIRVGGGGIDSSGPIVRVSAGDGVYRYRRLGVDVRGRVAQLDIMGGYQWVDGNTRISVYAGGEYQDHKVTTDPTNPVQGEDTGFKGQVEYYGNPTSDTMGLFVGSYSTVHDTYYVLARFGMQSVGSYYVGPEAAFSGNTRYNAWRLGVHATGFNVGPVGFGGSVGYETGDDDRDTIYFSLGLTLRR